MINAFFIIFLYIYFLLTGNGGDAGRIRLYFSKLRGQIALKTCRGKEARQLRMDWEEQVSQQMIT